MPCRVSSPRFAPPPSFPMPRYWMYFCAVPPRNRAHVATSRFCRTVPRFLSVPATVPFPQNRDCRVPFHPAFYCLIRPATLDFCARSAPRSPQGGNVYRSTTHVFGTVPPSFRSNDIGTVYRPAARCYPNVPNRPVQRRWYYDPSCLAANWPPAQTPLNKRTGVSIAYQPTTATGTPYSSNPAILLCTDLFRFCPVRGAVT